MESQLKSRQSVRIIGRVHNVIKAGGYGFIHTDDSQKFFFHVNWTREKALPEKNSIVEFTPVYKNVNGKKSLAVRVEVIS